MGDLGGSLLVGEQAGAFDDLEPGVGERADHRPCSVDREERVLIAPDQLDRDIDPTMQDAQITHVLFVEGAEQFDEGLSRLSFGRVANRLAVNDRIVVYYFPTKDDLVGEVVMAMGRQLQETLAPAFAEPAAGHLELLRTVWPMLARPDADPIFALFFEANGLAAAGREPYATLVPQLVEVWIRERSVDTGPVNVDHLRQVAQLAEDLDDAAVMSGAWS